jgi:predicted secreted hydrolase
MDWKNYPYQLLNDPQLCFPGAEGDQGAESNTYYVAGRLRGRATQHEYAFLVIFTFNNIRQRLRADFFTFALFDLHSGRYGTFSEFDLPWPPRLMRDYKLSVAKGGLDVAFASRHGRSTWRTRRRTDNSLLPFAYHVSLVGRDADAQRMHVDLDLDTFKPPMPVGGTEYGGVKTCIGQYGTHSYFQSDVRFRGTLEWGDVREEVDGDCGWIDRQWTPRYLGVHNDRRARRYRHEWRQLHLDNGYELSVWQQVDRQRGNRLIPFSGATAATPDGRVLATTDVTIDRLSFVRDPGAVKARYQLTAGPRYFTDRYALRVPAWDLDVVSEPLVPTPAHALPIEYWSGPTRVVGRMAGEPVRGFGFHERTMAFARDFELVDVLRQSVRHQPESAFAASGHTPLTLANQIWELDGFLSHHDPAAARQFLEARILPVIEQCASPIRDDLTQIASDLAGALGKKKLATDEHR